MEQTKQQMMACLLDEIRTCQEHLKEDMLAKIDPSQEKVDANREMLARTVANQERMDARINAKHEKLFEVFKALSSPEWMATAPRHKLTMRS
jgi:hypothetical protein